MSNIVINPYSFGGGGAVGGWTELDRTTLLAPNTEIDITGLPNKQYYMILRHTLGQNVDISHNGGYQLNGDTAANYAVRRGYIGASAGTNVNFNDIDLWDTGNVTNFHAAFISNIAGSEKLFYAQNNNQNTGGSSTAPYAVCITGKWANTTNAIDQITLKTLSANTWNTGSEVIVLGYDESDTHTDSDNFWQELASADLSGGTSDDLSSGTFTAKKYLFVQAYTQYDTSNIACKLTFNGDTGTLYSISRSKDRAARVDEINQTSIDTRGDNELRNWYHTMYIINNSGNEKLVNGNVTLAESGAANYPNTTLYGAKWDNTASQITEINFNNDAAGNYGTDSIIKVWGHD